MALKENQKKLIHEVHSFIESLSMQRFTIKDLAKISNLSEDKLTKGFKELYFQSIYQYKLSVSMEYAATLLRKGVPVKTVAIELGYRSTGSFTRAFTRMFKYPPRTLMNEGSLQ